MTDAFPPDPRPVLAQYAMRLHTGRLWLQRIAMNSAEEAEAILCKIAASLL